MSKAEDFIKAHTRNCSNIFVNPQLGGTEENQPWLTPDQAREAVEIARKEIYKWLEKNAHKYATIGIYTDAMIIDLKQVIKDK